MTKIKQYNSQKQNISYSKRNIFESIQDRINAEVNGCTVIVPHVCNNINVFGGGFTKDINIYYPIVGENFHMLGKSAKLGKTQFVIADTNKSYGHQIIFANMIAQNGIISTKNPRPLNYIALSYCINEITNYISSLKQNSDFDVEIHAPKFGSGLAGGNWSFISELISDSWNKYNTFIYLK